MDGSGVRTDGGEFLEKQTQSQAQSPKTKRLSRDQELAEKFAKKREYMKRKKMHE